MFKVSDPRVPSSREAVCGMHISMILMNWISTGRQHIKVLNVSEQPDYVCECNTQAKFMLIAMVVTE